MTGIANNWWTIIIIICTARAVYSCVRMCLCPYMLFSKQSSSGGCWMRIIHIYFTCVYDFIWALIKYSHRQTLIFSIIYLHTGSIVRVHVYKSDRMVEDGAEKEKEMSLSSWKVSRTHYIAFYFWRERKKSDVNPTQLYFDLKIHFVLLIDVIASAIMFCVLAFSLNRFCSLFLSLIHSLTLKSLFSI